MQELKKNPIRHTLTLTQSAMLVHFIMARFAKENKHDAAFAEIATKELGFEVTGVHVHTRRTELKIPFAMSEDTTPQLMSVRIKELEAKVDGINKTLAATIGHINKLCKNLGEDQYNG
jgi:hypothetical protein